MKLSKGGIRMKRNLKRFIAFSLSLAIVGTSVNVPVSTVKANTLDKGTPFTGCNIVSSADDDVKFTKGADSQNKAKASKPDYWGILDGDTSLTKLGTYNEEEDEYAVMIRLFGKEESKVYFHKDEIKYVD